MRHLKTYEVRFQNFTKFNVGDYVRLTSEEYIPSYWKTHNLDVRVLKVVTVDPNDTLAYELKVVGKKQKLVGAYWFEEYQLEKLSDYEVSAIKYNL